MERALQRLGLAVRHRPEPPRPQARRLTRARLPSRASRGSRAIAFRNDGRVRAVERAVVPGEREQADVVDRDRVVAVGTLDHDRLLADAVGRDDRDLRLVDDRRTSASVPNGPMFVIVNVPPTTSSGPSCFDFARAARSRISRAIRRSRLPSALRITGAIRPLKSRSTAMPRLQVAVHDERVAVDARVDVRVVVHDVAERAHDERQVREREALLGLPRGLVRAPRRARSRSKSTRTDVYTCALVAFDRTMCSAVRRRMLSNGTTSSPAPRATRCRRGAVPARRAGAGGGGRRRARARRRGRRTARAAAASSTSLRVMRPPSPVPRICAGSRPCSAIMRRTSGDVTSHRRRRSTARPRAPAPARARAAGAGGRSGRGCRGGRRRRGRRRGRRARRRGAGAGAAAGAAAGAPAPSEITARRDADVDRVALGHEDLGDDAGLRARAPRSRPCRSRPRTAARRPSTVSPTCLNQRVIVPSVTVSPSCGIVTSTSVPPARLRSAVQAAAGQRERRLAEQLRQRRVRVDQQTRHRPASLPSSPTRYALGDQLGRPRPGDVHAEDRPVALGRRSSPCRRSRR